MSNYQNGCYTNIHTHIIVRILLDMSNYQNDCYTNIHTHIIVRILLDMSNYQNGCYTNLIIGLTLDLSEYHNGRNTNYTKHETYKCKWPPKVTMHCSNFIHTWICKKFKLNQISIFHTTTNRH